MFETVDDLFSWMESFANFEKTPAKSKREFRLDRMERLAALFHHPQNACRMIHVAGSKGKGSTSAYMAQILNRAGFRTGLYTSPHIESWTERIAVIGERPDHPLYLRLGNEIRETLGDRCESVALPGGLPTTFELLTLLAFCYFREKNCDWVVLETGLGGRLDATNIVTPEVSVITSLELEHTEILGHTLPEIAAEKGGIIKKGVPVFLARQEDGPLSIFRTIAFERGTHAHHLSDFITLKEGVVTLKGQRHHLVFRYTGKAMDIPLRMPGARQGENAALAILVIRSIFPDIRDAVIRAGVSRTVLPGRMEILSETPYLLLDSAHTRESVRSAAQIVRQIPLNGPRVLVFGCLKEKDAEGMASVLAGNFHNILVTTPGHYRESDPEEVFNIFFRRFPGSLLVTDPHRALEMARSLAGKKGIILVTGSFYLAGEIRRSEIAQSVGKSSL